MIYEEQHIYRHRMPAQLRFSDVDRFGHVNNSVYFSLFDMCKTRYFHDVVGTDIFDRMAPVVVHIEANFMSPVLFPDEIVIDTSIVKIGTKSFTLMQRAVNERTEQVKCVCKTVMVMMDTNTNVSVEIDSEFRRKVEEFEKD
ncbi:MAG: acyl-CoA thioesterase [Prevotella sp.]|nr:acyl-CoA thioesterase [Prevotella sp.]